MNSRHALRHGRFWHSQHHKMPPWVLLIFLIGFLLRFWILLTKPEVLWIDDTFYSLGIARNIALGNGWTHDGINVTNGFQPLYVFLMIPFYWAFPTDGYVIPVLVLFLQSIMNLITGWMVFWLIRRLVGQYGAFYALLVWIFSPYIISGINGLETSIQALLIVYGTWRYVSHWRDILIGETYPFPQQIRIAVTLGIFSGIAIFNRFDTALFTGTLVIDLIARFFWVTRDDRSRLPHFLKLLSITLVLTALPVMLWFFLSYINTGRFFFDSGIAIRIISTRWLGEYDIISYHINKYLHLLREPFLSQFLLPVPMITSMPRILLALCATLISGVWVYKIVVDRRYAQIRRNLAELSFLWGYSAILVSIYVLYLFADSNWSRYFYPLTLGALIIFATFIEIVLDTVKGHLRSREYSSHHVTVLYIVACIAYVGSVMFTTKTGNPIVLSSEDAITFPQYRAAFWLGLHAKPNTRVGAFQSGILGYFSQNVQVINLDGVVNYSVISYLLDDTVAEYMQQQHIVYLVDWPFIIDVRVNFDHLVAIRLETVAIFESRLHELLNIKIYHLNADSVQISEENKTDDCNDRCR